ncbi:Plasmodium exported protein, unknown function [Plasmodium gonderi]|uniref:Uncharacterized protein n=1 Tax=Plasmodium gonderi TaxID=77519 RepID=A0A1Y1JEX3_PLAGO|nr:Plasmodium exported protein, unknown function [Plasmodium gonderi]GAW80800.1 Plasmodium exported protein, unknown function [Plasmodium gonderi]
MEYHHRLNINFLFLIKILSLTIIPCYRKAMNRINKQQDRVDLRNKRLLSIYTYDEENLTESNDSIMSNMNHEGLKCEKECGIKCNRRSRKPNIFKRIDQHFEKKIFSAFNEMTNLEAETKPDPAKIKKKIIKTVLKVLKPQLILLLLSTILILFSSSLPTTFEKSGVILMIISLVGCFYVLAKAFKYAWTDISSYLNEINT